MAGYHGGSTMVHLGRGGGLHPVSTSSLRAALVTGGDLELHPVEVFSEDERDWNDPARCSASRRPIPSPGWTWHRPDRRRHRADLGRQPGDPALEPRRRPVDPPGRRLRRLHPAAGDVRGDAERGGGVPHAAQHGRARAARAVPGDRGRHREGQQPGASGHTRASGTSTAASSAPPSSRPWTGTTPRPWWSSTWTSGTPTRSGCCRTAARSPSTARRAPSPRTY